MVTDKLVGICIGLQDAVLPKAPEDLVATLSLRYIELYERITGQKFQFPSSSISISDRVSKNIEVYAASL
jgi:phosphoribosylaminoimidazole-succinocarboxamide synthase